MPNQSRPTGAVFLSYASQDAEAAARICKALRAAGVEVWIDQSELRGGDAWDAQIKKHIHECALFLPLISAHTNARSEGYFRREWNFGRRRLLDMADDAAFLLPVVIDETREAEARVPEEFLRAQWTRLPGGETPLAFAQRVRQLLGGDSAGAHPAQSGVVPVIEPSMGIGNERNRGTRTVRLVSLALIALLVLAAGAFWYYRDASDAPAAMRGPTTASPEAAAAPSQKSIAVLPFVNMSPDKDQDYFADGISEELLNLLAKIPQLRVTSRSSAFSFKGQNLDMPEIAKRLNVSHILEGSVRKSGNQVRITAQLIDTRSDTHLWSETYDRPLDNIFAVQDEIAGAVVAQLKLKLVNAAPKTKATDPKAYALYLQARQLHGQYTPDGLQQSIALYRQALAIDTNYAEAWIGLARVYRWQANLGWRPVDEGYRLAREAVNKALSIDPDFAPAHAALGSIALDYDNDIAAAARHLNHALALEPTNIDLIGTAAALAASLGRLDTAIALNEYMVARDPVSAARHADLAIVYLAAGRLDEALASNRTVLSLSPGFVASHEYVGMTLLLKGDHEGALAEMQKESSEEWRLIGLAMAFHALGRKAESDAALAELLRKFGKNQAFNIAEVLAYRGEADRAFEWLDKAVAQHDLSDPNIEPLLANLHKDSRWLPFMRKVGRAPEQLAAIQLDVKLPE